MKRKLSCKTCRRVGMKLFLKGEKCFTPKCPLVRRPYPPGIKGKRRKPPLSEYGEQLREKQKLKAIYGIGERQLKKYVMEVLQKKGKSLDLGDELIRKLELRLDRVVYQLGFATSQAQAKQLVSHSYFVVNNKKINIPSFQLKVGDVVSLKEEKKKKKIVEMIRLRLRTQKVPDWLSLDKEKLEGKVEKIPTLKEVLPPFNIHQIFEYYSK
jgi:small subunit ribosomal protein S4